MTNDFEFLGQLQPIFFNLQKKLFNWYVLAYWFNYFTSFFRCFTRSTERIDQQLFQSGRRRKFFYDNCGDSICSIFHTVARSRCDSLSIPRSIQDGCDATEYSTINVFCFPISWIWKDPRVISRLFFCKFENRYLLYLCTTARAYHFFSFIKSK